MNPPLAGRLVADPTQNVAGPYYTQILPDMGVQVVKTERHGERPAISRVLPLLGEHTAEALAELGYDDATIEELAARHVVQL